jgi:hypothetical protein
MAKDKDQLRREYEARHAISNPNQYREISSTDGDGRPANQSPDRIDGESDRLVRGTTTKQRGAIIDAGSTGKQYRGERVDGREDEFSDRGVNQNPQRYGGVDRGTEGETVESVEPVELSPDRIINVATTATDDKKAKKAAYARELRARQKQGQGKEPAQQVRAVVVDILKGPEVEATRKRLRYAIIGMFRAFDDFINLTLKEKPPEPLMIWTAIDDVDIDTLVEARISRAQHSVIEARVVKGIITLYEQFATGLITVPRMWQTYVAWQMYGFELPGASMFPRQRRRRNLRVVDNQPERREPESGNAT